MSQKLRMLCVALAVLLALTLPLYLSSGALIGEVKARLLEEKWAREDGPAGGGPGWLRFLFPFASAEAEAGVRPLPVDFSPGPRPDPAGFSPQGYEDASIRLALETLDSGSVVWRIARVSISDPSQLRTATAGSLTSSRVALISSMAKKYNAVLALNANYFVNDPAKTSFEYRMGSRIRARLNRKKDLLIIDEKADFHLFVKSDAAEVDAFLGQGRTIVNAFTFGPALVADGTLLSIDPEYGYNPHGREPRIAIGQTGALEYVVVLAEGRTKESQGVTQQELADFMYGLGCLQAFNLDGGNSATMVFNGGYYQDKSVENERAQSDMIYFASAVGPASPE